MGECEKFAHKPVCGKYVATGGHVRECEHFMEVVRCKDCEHWHEETGWGNHHSHFIDSDGEACHPWESSQWNMLDADDFCSYGERGAEDENHLL